MSGTPIIKGPKAPFCLKTAFGSNADPHESNTHNQRSKGAILSLPWKATDQQDRFCWLLGVAVRFDWISSTFDSNRRSFNYLSRPKLSLGSAHMNSGVWLGPYVNQKMVVYCNLAFCMNLFLYINFVFRAIRDYYCCCCLHAVGKSLGRDAGHGAHKIQNMVRKEICHKNL